MTNKLVFLCGARDFHAMDWYKSAKEYLNDDKIIILTDLIEGEGFKKIVSYDDKVVKLLILDNFLFRRQSSAGNLWRNILKLLVLPIQVLLVRRYYKRHQNSVFHAHSMYYLWLAWLAKVPFVGTPQGSDILIKPFRSKIFKWLSARSMRSAIAVTVDSEKMMEGVRNIAGIEAIIIQNGIDLKDIEEFFKKVFNTKRDIVLSIRAFSSLYRIKNIILARDNNLPEKPITFIYPFYEKQYRSSISLKSFDSDLGRVSRMEMYHILSETQLVISIPSSDSSPRSVYESIFCGAAVAIVYNSFFETLPECMKKRIILIRLEDTDWLKKAILKSVSIVKEKFCPCETALDLFDQRRSFNKIYYLFLNSKNLEERISNMQ